MTEQKSKREQTILSMACTICGNRDICNDRQAKRGGGDVCNINIAKSESAVSHLESLGMCFKTDDQSLPENPYKLTDRERRLHLYDDAPMTAYSEAQQDMLKDHWVKVEKE